MGQIIFLNRFFYPDHSATAELLSDLAFALSKRGFQLTVITSRQNYERPYTTLAARQVINRVNIWRVWSTKRGRLGLIGRSADYVTFYLAAACRLWLLTHRGDVVVAKTDPPMLSIIAAIIAKLREAHLVNWLQDIFPEVAEALNVGGAPGHLVFRMLRPLRNWSLRAAAINVVVGEGMAERLRRLKIPAQRIQVISNWSDGTRIAPLSAPSNLRNQWVPAESFIVGYAGNLGRAHDIDTIVEAITTLHERAAAATVEDIARKILFIFVGGGAQRAKLEREVSKRGLTNVRLHSYQPRERLSETLAVADVHLVSLKPKLEGLIVPSKFYGIAAAGRSTIFIGAADGEIARLVEKFGCGFTVAPGDGEELAERILQLAQDPKLCATLGAHARAAFEKNWDQGRAVEKWEELLKTVMTSGTQARTTGAAACRSSNAL